MKTYILLLLLTLSVALNAHAASATWNLNPSNGDWNTAGNWTPATVPNGSTDTATFDVSNQTSLTLSANTEVNGIVFNAGASAFTIALSGGLTLTLSGTGITNNSGITQNFIATDGAIVFNNSRSRSLYQLCGGEQWECEFQQFFTGTHQCLYDQWRRAGDFLGFREGRYFHLHVQRQCRSHSSLVAVQR